MSLRPPFAVLALVLASTAGASAAILDLTTPQSMGMINGARFESVDFPYAGTGNLDPFVRMQATGTEQGYNTSGRPTAFNENSAANFTRDLALSSIPIFTIGSTSYYEFWLDVNQNTGGDNELISLDKIQIYTSATPGQTTSNVASLGALRYDLDTGGDNWIRLDYTLGAGSGRGDMRMFVPTSMFAGAGANDFVYLYSFFGTNHASNDGFEEWAVLVVPSPGASMALALGGLTLARRRRR